MCQIPCCPIRRIDRRKEHDVSFVSLHVVDVLDRQWFRLPFERCLDLFATGFDKKAFDVVPLSRIESDHHDAFRGIGRYGPFHFGDHGSSLFGIAFARARYLYVFTANEHRPDRVSPIGGGRRGNSRECPFIEFAIGDLDKTFVAAPIVPGQSSLLESSRGGKSDNRLHTTDMILANLLSQLVEQVSITGTKEFGRRRHLSSVTDEDR